MKGIIHCGAHHGEAGCGACRRCQALAAARLHEPETEFRPLPIPSPNAVGGFSLYDRPRRRGVDDSARARNVDAIVAWARQAR